VKANAVILQKSAEYSADHSARPIREYSRCRT
jgi:hypothetical protein